MLRYFKSIIHISFMLCIYNCGTNVSNTKIPLSTKSLEANDLYHDALHLRDIFRENEA